MRKAEVMHRFLGRAGVMPHADAEALTKEYRRSPDADTLTFSEWTVMLGHLTPEQARTIEEFFDNTRFQCLECGQNVYGREFTDPWQMVCPFCLASEFQLRGTIHTTRVASPRGAVEGGTASQTGPLVPMAPDATGSHGDWELGDLASADSMSRSTSNLTSRAPKLPTSGEASVGDRMLEPTAEERAELAEQGSQRKRRPVPLEVLSILKGRSIESFLEDLPRYAHDEWSTALDLITYLDRRDLVPVAVDDGVRRLVQLGQLARLVRLLSTYTAVAEAFVVELVCDIGKQLSRLAAFLAHQQDGLEDAIDRVGRANFNPKRREAQLAILRSGAGDVAARLKFFLDPGMSALMLSRLVKQHPGAANDPTEITRDLLDAPEPFVRALAAHGASDGEVLVEPFELQQRMEAEAVPVVSAALEAAIDGRQGAKPERLTIFERVLVLKQTPLFTNLDRKSLVSLAAVLDESRVPAGATVVEQGTPGEAAYILVSGDVDVIRIQPDKTERLLNHLRAPQIFGEMALLG